MKAAIQSKSALTTLVVLLSFTLFGICVASDKDQFLKDMKVKGVHPLSTDEITELYSDSSEYVKNQKYEREGFK